MRRFRLFSAIASLLVAAACSLPDLPVPAESGGTSSISEAGQEGATSTATGEGGEDSASAEGGVDSGTDVTIESGADGSDGSDATIEAGGNDSGGSDAGPDGMGKDASAEGGTGAVAVLASACSSPAALACAGNMQKVTLICSGGAWTYASTCPSGQNCDSRPGSNQGTCATIDPPCTSARPGDHVCGSSMTVVACGPDLVSDSPVVTCTNQACVGGACAGVCAPGATQCSGNGVQTCGASGTWGSAVACSNSTCAVGMCSGSCSPGATQCSGTSAVQSCVAGSWGTPKNCTNQACVGGVCTGMCSPATTECTSETLLATCNTSGQWGGATTCTNACVGTVGAVGGTCGGVCKPATTECTSDTLLATCNTSGQWGVATTCTNACVGTIGVVGGTCGGVCVPNAKQCSGNGVETCGSNGQWGGAVACSGTTTSCANGACVAPPSPTSCQTSGAGLTNCGASSESCCTSLEVTPNGPYYRTYTNSGSGPTGEADPATVSGFRLDKYLVTVGRFRRFVSAWNAGAGYTPPGGSGKHMHLNGGSGLSATGGAYEPGWVATDDSNIAPTDANLACNVNFQTWTVSAGGHENLPINCVNWWESYAFCIWDGGFLPSEAEWEYAAAGGSQQREYPWGATAPGTGNQYAIYQCEYPIGTGSCADVTNIAPVGTATLGAGLWGQLDLEGSVFEWNLDWYAPYSACTDCADVTSSTIRVIRGADFGGLASDLLPPNRIVGRPESRMDNVGFRCARTP